jgi:hypothetical protein
METMGRINVKVEEDVDRRFRREVFRRKGMKKGNLTDALEEAMIMWVNASPPERADSDLNKDETDQ